MFLSIYLFFLFSGFMLCMFIPNPTFLISWLIILSVLTGMILLNNISSWMMYAVILLFTGGMMILFSYLTSLILVTKINFFSLPKIFIIFWLSLMLFNTQPIKLSELNILSKLFFESKSIILMLMAIYLLLVLVSMMKLASSLNGPMKSFFINEK